MSDDPYYQERILCWAGDEPLNLKIHRAEEMRDDDWLMRPLRRRVPATYVHARSYLLKHQPVLTVGLYARPSSDGAIGEVIHTELGDWIEQDVGNCQAWIYGERRAALIWEAYLFEPFRTLERQVALWRAFEEWLEEQAPIEEFYTPGWDPAFGEGEYKAVLRELGFSPVKGTRLCRKEVRREGVRGKADLSS